MASHCGLYQRDWGIPEETGKSHQVLTKKDYSIRKNKALRLYSLEYVS